MPRRLARSHNRAGPLLAAAIGLMTLVADAASLQSVLAPWFADRKAAIGPVADALAALGKGGASGTARLADLLLALKSVYWHMLDAMNAIEVVPGQVIYNATPRRLLAGRGGIASAEVHALGNPEGREILALEIRRPGPTFRAWDNVRFPPREVDVGAALAALNLKATRPEEFIRERTPVAGRDGAFVSVDCEYFRVEHLVAGPGQRVAMTDARPVSLHCIGGSAAIVESGGRSVGRLEQGESALVPVGVGASEVAADVAAHLICVIMPAKP